VIPKPVEAVRIVFLSLITFIFFTMTVSLIPNWLEFQAILLIIGNLIFFFVPFIYLRIRKFDLNSLFRIKSISIQLVIYSVILGLALTIITDEIDRLLRIIITPPEWLSQQAELLEVKSLAGGLLLVIGTVILTPVCEELIFRGFVQVPFERTTNPNRTIIVSSLLWTSIHMNIFWAIPIFIMGIFLGYLAWQTQSTFPSIIVHAVNNVMALLFINYDLDTNLYFYTWQDHVSPAIIVLALAMIFFSVRAVSNHRFNEK
jgi:membrane protease YdiL (CAAX protease family)